MKEPRAFCSIESIDPEDGPDVASLIRIGERMSELDANRKYILYKDPEGGGWYETMVRGPDGCWRRLEEHIFRRRLPEKRKKKRR